MLEIGFILNGTARNVAADGFINRIELSCHGSIIVCIQFQDLLDPMNH